MKKDDNVNINGRVYDKTTGMPVTKSAKIKNVQSIAQKSQSLYNRAVQQPTMNGVSKMRRLGRSMDVSRSKNISHFSKTTVKAQPGLKPASAKPISNNKRMDIKPTRHPLVAKIEQKRATKIEAVKPVIKSAKTIKQEAIAEAMSKTDSVTSKQHNFFRRCPKIINIFTIGLILVIVAAYFTYMNLPSISVRVASAQANISAKYPNYTPDGYSINGPVSYSDGKVTIKYKSNTNDTNFIITQKKSTWDSSALEARVGRDSDNEYLASQENGITIYTYDSNAYWVNGGILYSVTGNAKLDTTQIRHIVAGLL